MPGIFTHDIVDAKRDQTPPSSVFLISLQFLRLVILLGFRLLFPSWKFFNCVGEIPQLLVREQDRYGAWSDRQPLCQPRKRQWFHFWINSEYNDFLARGSVLQRFCEQVEEYSENTDDRSVDLRTFSTYRMLQRFVELVISRRTQVNALSSNCGLAIAFQFKVVVHRFSRNDRRVEDFAISRIYMRSTELLKPWDVGSNHQARKQFEIHQGTLRRAGLKNIDPID